MNLEKYCFYDGESNTNEILDPAPTKPKLYGFSPLEVLDGDIRSLAALLVHSHVNSHDVGARSTCTQLILIKLIAREGINPAKILKRLT